MIPLIKRSKSGIRDYGEADLKLIEFIKCMRNVGISIEVLIEYVALFLKGEETISTKKNLLVEQRHKLLTKMEELKNIMDTLNYKIEGHKNTILKNKKR